MFMILVTVSISYYDHLRMFWKFGPGFQYHRQKLS